MCAWVVLCFSWQASCLWIVRTKSLCWRVRLWKPCSCARLRLWIKRCQSDTQKFWRRGSAKAVGDPSGAGNLKGPDVLRLFSPPIGYWSARLVWCSWPSDLWQGVCYTQLLWDICSLFGLLTAPEGAKSHKSTPVLSHIKDYTSGWYQEVIFMYERCHYVNQAGQLDWEWLSLGAALCVCERFA